MVRLYYTRHPSREGIISRLGDIVARSSVGMLCKKGEVGECEKAKSGIERRVADSGATFHIINSTDMLRDVQLSEERLRSVIAA